MDQVVSEVLRKWPAALAIDRECNKDISYEVDGKTVEIKKGQAVWLPVAGFHRDPKYYENPDKFDPERFSDENKDKIKPFTYYPFGLGQRNCIGEYLTETKQYILINVLTYLNISSIGSRFALLEAKAVIYYLIRDFRIEVSKKSTVPMKLSANGFQLEPKNGFWLKLVPRN